MAFFVERAACIAMEVGIQDFVSNNGETPTFRPQARVLEAARDITAAECRPHFDKPGGRNANEHALYLCFRILRNLQVTEYCSAVRINS